MTRIIGFILLSIAFATNISIAQNKKYNSSRVQTDTIRVEGVCSQCKSRIEEAAYIRGVRRAEWDKASKQLTVVYNPQRVKKEDVEKSIAKSGHSTENQTRDQNSYDKLPSCCAYDHAHDH